MDAVNLAELVVDLFENQNQLLRESARNFLSWSANHHVARQTNSSPDIQTHLHLFINDFSVLIHQLGHTQDLVRRHVGNFEPDFAIRTTCMVLRG